MPPSNCLVFVRKFFGGPSSTLREDWLYNGYIDPETQSMWVFNEFNELMRLLDEDSFEVYPGV
jgi:hypothetical protein